MSLSSGDLTTLVRAQLWVPGIGASNSTLVSSVIIPDASRMIVNKLNRARLNYQTFTRIIDGVGNYQIVLPDYPVVGITSLQMGSVLVSPFPLPTLPGVVPIPQLTLGGFSGYRFVPWMNDLPGLPAVVEMVNGVFWRGVQNIKVVYQAGYVVQSEPHTVPANPGPYTITVDQPQGIWSQDNGVAYASSGVPLVPVPAPSVPTVGQYNPPADPPGTLAALGQYTFAAGDAGQALLITYSFVPSDLESACLQMVGETLSYRDRIGQLDKTLGGQETIRFLRGGIGRGQVFGIPPEVEDRIWPYVNVVPPAIGAPV